MSFLNTATLVPILNKTNYRQWAVAIKAYIISTSMWAYVKGNKEREKWPLNKKEHN